MYQELFTLGGYGYFVWPSFVFTLAILYNKRQSLDYTVDGSAIDDHKNIVGL